jgi:transposase
MNEQPRSQYDATGQGTAGPALEQVRQTAQVLVEEGRGVEALDFVLSALAAVLSKSRELELQMAKLLRERVGRTSERVDPGQLALLFQELVEQLGPEAGTPDPEAEARQDRELEEEIEREGSVRRRRKQGGRNGRGSWRTDPSVQREVHHVEVAQEERTCGRCGDQKVKIGEDVSRVLDYVPGHFVEREYHREKLACGRCKRGVTVAPAPAKVLGRSPAGASLLAQVVVSKYGDHCPLHRQKGIYERQGASIPVSTMADWVGGVASLLEPLVDHMLEVMVREAYVVRTDATSLKALDPGGPGNIRAGTVWTYVGDDRDVVFRFAPTGEGARGPWKVLAGREGYVQADAASVFDRLYNGQVARAVEVGCWAHGRRRFVALQDTDCRVAYPLKLMGRLYRTETLADLKGLEGDDRAAFRRERDGPTLDTLHRWLVYTAATEPPRSEMAKASGYLLNQWQALTRFVDDGRLSLDNNLCERQIRDIALGRKNYLFAGSPQAARHAATLYSLLRTCALHGVAPLPYLTDVLTTLAAGWRQDHLEELLPGRWKLKHAPL